MAQDLVVNGVTYPAVEKLKMTNASGEQVLFGLAQNYKKFFVTVPTAVASQDVKVVSGDPDVAEHYDDATASCTVRKVSNNDTNGCCMFMCVNHSFAGRYGMVFGYNAAANTVSAATWNFPLSADTYPDAAACMRCNSNGDIIVRANRQQTNFGGADYIIEFSW